MKNGFISFLLLTLMFLLQACESSVRSPYPSTELNDLFDNSKISTITVSLSAREWQKLLDHIDANPRTETMVHADFMWQRGNEKVVVKNIGFRIRGNVFSRKRPEGDKGERHNTLNPDWHHAHFKIRFNKFNKKQKWKTLNGLNLKWFNNDPSYVREIYSYDLFRRFGVWTAVKNSYTRLYIKFPGENKTVFFGVYDMLEPIDKAFVKRRFKDDKGDLWKCLYGADMRLSGARGKMKIEKINPTNKHLDIHPPYDLKTNKKRLEEAKKRFLDFIRNLNYLKGREFERWAVRHIDIDLFLRYLAVNTMVGMWDDYWINRNNYYFYLDSEGLGYFIPYDYDNTLGTGQIVNNIGTRDVLKWSPNTGNRPLVRKILAISRFCRQYERNIKKLIDERRGLFSFRASTNRIRQWQKLIRPFVKNDTGEDEKIIDRPASWANTPFYRLLKGDDRGGPMEANYFLTRIRYAKMQLGMMKKPVTAKISFRIRGLKRHPNGYFYSRQKNFVISLGWRSDSPLTSLKITGMINSNFTSPESPLILHVKNTNRALDIQKLFLLASNENKLEKSREEDVLFFTDKYESPYFSVQNVIFRLKFENALSVELSGSGNRWGKEKKIFLKKTAESMWTLTTNKDFWPNHSIYYFHVVSKKDGVKKSYWISDPANINVDMKSHFASVYLLSDDK